MQLRKMAFLGLFGLYFGTPQPLWAELGFAPAATANVPEAVRASAQKVLELWTPAVTESHPESEYSSLQIRALQNSTSDVREKMRFKINLLELGLCQKNKMPNCLLTTRVGRGSAFVLSGGILVAARHDFSVGQMGLVEKFGDLAAFWAQRKFDSNTEMQIQAFQQNPLRDAVFLLSDGSGRVIYDSGQRAHKFLRFGNVRNPVGLVDLRSDPPRAHLQGENFAAEAAEYSGVDWVNQDLVEIQLPNQWPSLNLASVPCPAESPSYIAGFAAQTETRASYHARDAVDRELAITQGSILSADQFKQRGRVWPFWNSFLQELGGRAFLLTDADGAPGMSGAPILNSGGEVCGLYKGFMPSDQKISFDYFAKYPLMFTMGIPASEF